MITLHSNLVIFQLIFLEYTGYIEKALHSNLVIFQHSRQILWAIYLNALHSNLVIFQQQESIFQITKVQSFTFQSGYIPTEAYPYRVSPYLYLYIPIWLYSNNKVFLCNLRYVTLYIPIWLYSNKSL